MNTATNSIEKFNSIKPITNLNIFWTKFYMFMKTIITNADGGIKMKRMGFLIVISFISIMFCYSDEAEFYREFRYRVVMGNRQDTLNMKTPPVFTANSYSIIQEFRKVNPKNGLGSGGWKKAETFTANTQPTYYDVEILFRDSPKTWTEKGYRASLMPTIDNRHFWWDFSDGTFHYYVAYTKIQ
ncbi:MAG: hypothetical protein LBC27_06745 [Spirochaetaceae bacterium]|jgi:hypothetical protein|nr:hypothetical protein [Spirochaetaceae bacterium]